MWFLVGNRSRGIGCFEYWSSIGHDDNRFLADHEGTSFLGEFVVDFRPAGQLGSICGGGGMPYGFLETEVAESGALNTGRA